MVLYGPAEFKLTMNQQKFERNKMNQFARSIGVLFFLIVLVTLTSSAAYGAVAGSLFTGSSGTATSGIGSVVFNADSAAIGGVNFTCPAGGGTPCNNDVAATTALSFAGCASGVVGSPGCLNLQEGIKVDPVSAATVGDQTFMTFSNHPNLVFSLGGVTIPSATANCATVGPTQSCVLFPGAAVLLTEGADAISTVASLFVSGKASDTGVAGLAAGSNYSGSWSITLTSNLPGGFGLPIPQNIQRYFCGTNVGITGPGQCDPTKTLTTSNSGSFTVSAVPEPETTALTVIGSCLIGLGAWWRRKRIAARAE